MSELHDIIAELKSKVAGTHDVINLSIVLGTFFQSLATANEFFAYVRKEMLGLPDGSTDGTVKVDVILPSIWPTRPTDTVARLTLEAGERSAHFELRRAESGTTGSGFMLPSKPLQQAEPKTGPIVLLADLRSQLAGKHNLARLRSLLVPFTESLDFYNEFFAYIRKVLLGLPDGVEEAGELVTVSVVGETLRPVASGGVALLMLETHKGTAIYDIVDTLPRKTTHSGFALATALPREVELKVQAAEAAMQSAATPERSLVMMLRDTYGGTFTWNQLRVKLDPLFRDQSLYAEFLGLIKRNMFRHPSETTSAYIAIDVHPSETSTGCATLSIGTECSVAYFEMYQEGDGRRFVLETNPIRTTALKARPMRGYQPQLPPGMVLPPPPGYYGQFATTPQHPAALQGRRTHIELIFKSLDEVQHIFDMVLACKPNQTEDIATMREWIERRSSTREGTFFTASVLGNVSKTPGELQGVFKVMRGVESGSMPGATFEVLLSNFHPLESAIKA